HDDRGLPWDVASKVRGDRAPDQVVGGAGRGSDDEGHGLATIEVGDRVGHCRMGRKDGERKGDGPRKTCRGARHGCPCDIQNRATLSRRKVSSTRAASSTIRSTARALRYDVESAPFGMPPASTTLVASMSSRRIAMMARSVEPRCSFERSTI